LFCHIPNSLDNVSRAAKKTIKRKQTRSTNNLKSGRDLLVNSRQPSSLVDTHRAFNPTLLETTLTLRNGGPLLPLLRYRSASLKQDLGSFNGVMMGDGDDDVDNE
jgi:hypothetical protein